ncbi:MAG: hypothetical protein IKN72_11795, partial [Clostridia bacterium]|nr:hypothetical protein [Clostridia bacterium]
NLLSLFSLFSISKNPNCISFSSSFLLPLLYHICFLFERVFRGAQLRIEKIFSKNFSKVAQNAQQNAVSALIMGGGF